MKVVFVGSTKFGFRCLEKALCLPDIEVVGIITNPETFSISYRPSGVTNVLYRDFRPIAEQHSIPLWVMEGKMNDPGLIEQVRKWSPDLILVVGWYHMVPRAIREIAPAVGLHASLLPDYSGGAPLVWAMINGEEKTGITLFLLDDGVDNGDIIGQIEEPIYFHDTIATLYARIEEDGLQLVEEYLPKIAKGKVQYQKQDEGKRRTMPQRGPEDGLINWEWPAWRVYNFIRAQTMPYPGAFTYLDDQKVTIWEARLCGCHQYHYPLGGNFIPGQVIGTAKDRYVSGLRVVCEKNDTPLLITKLQMIDKLLTGVEFAQLHQNIVLGDLKRVSR